MKTPFLLHANNLTSSELIGIAQKTENNPVFAGQNSGRRTRATHYSGSKFKVAQEEPDWGEGDPVRRGTAKMARPEVHAASSNEEEGKCAEGSKRDNLLSGSHQRKGEQQSRQWL